MRRLLPAGFLAVIALTACDTGDGKTLTEPVFDPPAPPATTVPATSIATLPTLPTEPTAPPASAGNIIIDRLSSPANATAEIVGVGAIAGDAITVDDDPADVISFDVADDGSFVAQVWIEDEGAHTVCVADTCGRVYTLAPDAETPEEVIAKIEAAIEQFDVEYGISDDFPDWTVEIGGALSGTGGSVDVDTKTVTVYRNRGREIDDFVRTLLHEFGHVVDEERLTDDERAEYLRIRGIDPEAPWRTEGSHRVEDWAREPSEDFAEVMVVIWAGDRWEPRTTDLAAAPDTAQLARIAALIEA